MDEQTRPRRTAAHHFSGPRAVVHHEDRRPTPAWCAAEGPDGHEVYLMDEVLGRKKEITIRWGRAARAYKVGTRLLACGKTAPSASPQHDNASTTQRIVVRIDNVYLTTSDVEYTSFYSFELCCKCQHRRFNDACSDVEYEFLPINVHFSGCLDRA